jgi:hypothetical protein
MPPDVPVTASVYVPELVMGDVVPVLDKMFAAPVEKFNPTLVTVPDPDGEAQAPSPRRNVDAEGVPVAEIPPTGNPVAFVNVPDEGVPSAPPLTTNAPAEPTFVPNAVKTPVPVAVVVGGLPAPPPIKRVFAVKTAEDAHVEAELKYGIPPDVPATVSANVPDVVIGDPETDISPPVNDCPTLVTVPVPLTDAQDGFAAAPLV